MALKEEKMNSPWICPKCGAVMVLHPGIGYTYWWQCPNGCKQDYANVRTTASSMTAEEYAQMKKKGEGNE